MRRSYSVMDERRFAYEESIAVAQAACDHANAAAARAAGYLCGECAELKGAKWPKGHRATFHSATCPFCKNCRPIASWDDWSWPKAPGHDEIAKMTREA